MSPLIRLWCSVKVQITIKLLVFHYTDAGKLFAALFLYLFQCFYIPFLPPRHISFIVINCVLPCAALCRA